MANVAPLHAAKSLAEPPVRPIEIDVPQCERGIGSAITSTTSDRLIDGVRINSLPVWPDDRGHFMEVHRVGHGLASGFAAATSQVSATLTRPGVIKAFHYHQHQYDCWTVVNGMLQVALADIRRGSRTFGQRNTFYVGAMRPWQILIPPGVAHGYKVISVEPAMLVYVTSRFYDPADELRIPYNDSRLSYDWETQFK
jgi:dTDP-4-dehydrorhamnose 3,5-epimerase